MYISYLKRFFVAIIFVLFAIFPFQASAQEDLGGFTVDKFNTDIKINKDGSFDVVEKIDINFTEERHGIFRFIPLVSEVELTDGKLINRKIEISVTDVTRNGKVEKYNETTTHESNPKFKNSYYSRNYNLKNIKIGDKDVFVNGRQSYEISYHVENALVGNEEKATLYWGVTGNQWNVPISQAGSTVSFSDKDAKIKSYKCFAGDLGSTSSDGCSASSSQIEFTADLIKPLKSGQGFNIQVDFETSYLTIDPQLLSQSTPYDEKAELVYQVTVWALSIIFLLLPIGLTSGLYLHWLKKKGHSSKVISPEYSSPDNLRPAQVGLIYDQKLDKIDVSSTIIDLAERGYLKIRRIESGGLGGIFSKEDYLFINQNKDIGSLEPYEQTIFGGIFLGSNAENKLSDLKNTFYGNFIHIDNDIQNWALKTGYFESKTNKSGLLIGCMSIGSAILFFMLACQTALAPHPLFICVIWFVYITAFVSIFYMLKTMNHKSIKGIETLRRIKGLKQYISLAEKERINMLNAPEMTTELFEKLLPYAMVFGLHEAWANKFQGIYTTPPSWYEDNYAAFNAVTFANSLYHANTMMNSVLSSSPSSSGSGFSGGGSGGSVGGGFGGGGGGSW